MRKLFPLLILALSFTLGSCGGDDKKEDSKEEKSGWSENQIEKFMESCVKNASANPGINAEDYCSCMMDKVMEKYPKAVSMSKMDMKWMMEEAQKCLGTDLPEPTETVSTTDEWDDNNKTAFINSCKSGFENNPNVDGEAYCSCMLEKVMVKYPKPSEAANIDQDWMKEEAKNCLGL